MLEKKTHRHKEKGVVLIEAIIAIGVLVTMFTAALSLYMSSVGGMRMTNDELMATYLAQDGLEQVIAKRQYNYDNDLDWLEGLSACTTNPCGANYFNGSFNADMSSCSSLGSCVLYTDANGVYSHNSGGTESRFTRVVEIEILNSDVEARVTVRVSWLDGPITMNKVLTYNIFNNPNNNM